MLCHNAFDGSSVAAGREQHNPRRPGGSVCAALQVPCSGFIPAWPSIRSIALSTGRFYLHTEEGHFRMRLDLRSWRIVPAASRSKANEPKLQTLQRVEEPASYRRTQEQNCRCIDTQGAWVRIYYGSKQCVAQG